MPDAAGAPRTWLVIGDKLGDNAQIERVVSRLGWPASERRLEFRAPFRRGKPPFMASLYHVDRGRSARLEAPWPELVLTVGRRPAMAALWVRKRAARVGQTVRVVLFGRPKRSLGEFDLVVAPSQYRLPEADNVIRLALPLVGLDIGRVHAARESWARELAGLPRPLTALLVGGATRPYRLDGGVARMLVERSLAATNGEGTLYVSTSRRTGAAAVAALEAALPANGRLFAWRPDAPRNPYPGLLAHADRFVVTGDSMSMMVEVARLGKPLAIASLPRAAGAAWRDGLRWDRASGRDLSRLHEALYAGGFAAPLGEPWVSGGRTPEDETERVAEAVRRLMNR